MRFKFGKGKKLSDVLRVAQFLEDNDIEYEMLSDIDIRVGPEPEGQDVYVEETRPAAPWEGPTAEQLEKMAEAGVGQQAPPVDPIHSNGLWKPKQHQTPEGGIVACYDKSCTNPAHLGATFDF